jgi:stage II sporulation protein D
MHRDCKALPGYLLTIQVRSARVRRMRVPLAAAFVLCFAGCCLYHVPPGEQRPAPFPRLATPEQPLPGGEPSVRVRLTTNDVAFFSSSKGLTLAAGSSRQSVDPNRSIQVSLEGGMVVVTGGPAPLRTADTLAVAAGEGGFVRVGDRSYRGRLLLFRSTDGDLAVVNVLGLEDYLLGVVPCEIGPINVRTLEAAKAQAVAARSFTMTRLGRRKGLGHDLFDSYLRDQEYRGIERETELSRRAVTVTRGEVLEYEDRICEALYHGNCGGVTANGSQPYLRSVPDTPGHRRGSKAYCSEKPSSSWQTSLRRDSLDAVASRLSGKRCRVRAVSLETDRESGRVKCLQFATDHGSLRVPGSDFRMAMGLRSTAFTVSIQGRTASFKGRGWGHGSGMCQDGAIAMAQAGASYRDILQQYYSGVSLAKRY